MADFVYDVITLNGSKVDRAPIPVGEDPNKWLDVSDWNPAISALNDIRDAIINNRFLGLQRLGVQPNVPTGGAPDFLWMTSGGVPTFHIGGVNYNFMLASTLTAGVLPVATGVDTIGNSSFIATGPTLDITATAGGVMSLGGPNATEIDIGASSSGAPDPFIVVGTPSSIISFNGDGTETTAPLGGVISLGTWVLSAPLATAGTPLHPAPLIFFNPTYWDGTASHQDPWAITVNMDSTAPQSSMAFSLNNVTNLMVLRRTGALELHDGSTAAVSAAGFGALRYNNASHQFEQSLNGGAWSPLTASGTVTGTLTSGRLPVATGANSLGDSSFTASGTTLDLAAAGTLTIGGTATGINFLAGTASYTMYNSGIFAVPVDGSLDTQAAGTLNVGATNATAVNIGGSNSVVNLSGVTGGSGYTMTFNPMYFSAVAATSGVQLQSSPQLYFRTSYWNGTASTNYDMTLVGIAESTTPSGSIRARFAGVDAIALGTAGVTFTNTATDRAISFYTQATDTAGQGLTIAAQSAGAASASAGTQGGPLYLQSGNGAAGSATKDAGQGADLHVVAGSAGTDGGTHTGVHGGSIILQVGAASGSGGVEGGVVPGTIQYYDSTATLQSTYATDGNTWTPNNRNSGSIGSNGLAWGSAWFTSYFSQEAAEATAGATLQNAGGLTLRNSYWSGGFANNYDVLVTSVMDSTSPTAHLSMKFAGTEKFQFTSAGSFAIINNSIGTAQTVGASLQNNIAALVGTTQQFSPMQEFVGQSWNTTVTATSKTQKMAWQLRPVTGATTSPEMVLWASQDGGTYAEAAKFSYVYFAGPNVTLTLANGASVLGYNAGSAYAYVSTTSTQLHLIASGSVYTHSQLVPLSDNVYALGGVGNRWSNIWGTIFSNQSNNIGTAQTVGTTLTNNTAALVGTPQQYSPMLEFNSQAWNTTSSASEVEKMAFQLQPVTGATTSPVLALMASVDGAAYAATGFSVNSSGQTKLAGVVNSKRVTGGFRAVTTTPVTATVDDYIIGVNRTSATTINLPAASTCTPGQTLLINNMVGTSPTISITANGTDTINGATTQTIARGYGGYVIWTDGVSQWFISGSN